MKAPDLARCANIARASSASQFPERYFATCTRRADGRLERFRIYANSIAECRAKAKKAGDSNPPIYDAVLRSRTK